MASLSKVSGFIRIRDVVYLLTGVRSWPSRATCSLWMSWMVLSESPVSSAIRFTTAILLMVDLHAFSFSKKARTFSTICLLCDLSLTPFLRPFSRVFGLLCVAVSYWSYGSLSGPSFWAHSYILCIIIIYTCMDCAFNYH